MFGSRRYVRCRALLAVAVAAWPALVHAGSDEAGEAPLRDGLRLYESADGRFRVLLPAEPALVRSSRRTWLGRVDDLRVGVERDRDRWVVEAHDIPRAATRFLPSGIILDRARKGFLEDRRRVETERGQAVRDGYPAQWIRYVHPDDPECERVGLIVLVGRRVYIVSVRDSETARESLDPERFLGSFVFWEETPPPPRPAFIAPAPDEG
jgi:hypothetical protein